MSVADGVLIRASTHKEKWAIIAPTEDKARIIMDYIVDRIFDDALFIKKLEYNGSKEKLKQERSKTRITFKDFGEVRIYTGNATNTQATKKALMGFGAANIILDESSLVSDELYATVKRMLGGTTDNFLLEIGNPFYRNHFYRTWHSDRYMKVFTDVHKALEEGRYTPDYIDEMRDEAFFDVLYECMFPDQDDIRGDGYRRLIVDALITNSLVSGDQAVEDGDTPILGVDVAAGGANQTVFVLRYPKSGWAKVLEKNHDDDLDNQADRIIAYKNQYGIGDYRVVIDDGGVGHGLGDILKNKHDILFKRVLAGESAEENKRYANTKAELFWRVRKWLKAEGGKLVQDAGFEELSVIYYKQNATDKLQIEPKEKLRERGILSPDTADALMLTFINTSRIVDEDDIDID